MAVHYVGGEPTRITRYTTQKNTDRWMHTPKPKYHIHNMEVVLDNLICAAVVVFLLWFVIVCFR